MNDTRSIHVNSSKLSVYFLGYTSLRIVFPASANFCFRRSTTRLATWFSWDFCGVGSIVKRCRCKLPILGCTMYPYTRIMIMSVDMSKSFCFIQWKNLLAGLLPCPITGLTHWHLRELWEVPLVLHQMVSLENLQVGWSVDIFGDTVFFCDILCMFLFPLRLGQRHGGVAKRKEYIYCTKFVLTLHPFVHWKNI